jgi:hypoxanthine phosphoribosyltransferase
VLRGGVFFFADLVRALPVSVDVAPIQAQAYEKLQNGVQTPSIRVSYEGLELRGRSVLVVDDICDSGRTLEQLERLLLERGAREVRTAVLVRRLLATPTFVPCWVGLEYRGDDWLIGYGMDDRERWRNLPGVYRKQPQA